ncbi:MAG: ATP-binding protein, partial [Flavobacterium sp.]
LNNCLNEVLCSINSLIKKSKTTITIDFSKTNKILFKKSYLKSIFLNLITNAIKYAKPNTLPVITIRTERINTDTKLIISDDGIGFDMEKVKDKVFGLYQTFNDHIDSHGIGLYLVHNQVTTLGGTITLESEVNQGATFTITIKD